MVADASVSLSAAPARATAETDAWRAYAEADQLNAFAAAWLALVARAAPGWSSGALLLGPAERGPFEPVAHSPEVQLRDAVLAPLAGVVAAAVERRKPAVETLADGATRVGFPLLFGGELHGAVAAEARAADPAAARRLLRHLQWSAAGIEAFLARDARRRGERASERAQFLIGAMDALAEQEHGVDAARALANLAARRFHADSAAVGRYRRLSSRLVAVSQSATIDRRNVLSRAIEAAQDEAIDQGRWLASPRPERSGGATAAQDRLARALNGGRVLTLPLFLRDEAVGALTLRRAAPDFSADEIALADALAAAVGPLLAEKWRLDRSLLRLAGERLAGFAGRLFGPRRLALKLTTLALMAFAAFLVFATDTYWVRAHAQIQGETRRIAAAPFDGFIHAQYARAGDVVKKDDLLAALEDNDLELERLRQIARKREHQLELDKALGKRDLAEINIARAQIDQSDAEIDLSEQMIARAKLRAPFDAIVVSGDLSQSVGKPVSRGDALFELAPLDQYRVNALVPESDIGFVTPGGRGELLLSALPGRTFPVEIRSITAVAQTGEGLNGFETVAKLAGAGAGLRPGMEGIVKIDAGRRNIAWIWLHPVVDWLRIKVWSLAP